MTGMKRVGAVADGGLDADLGNSPHDRERVDAAVAQHQLQGVPTNIDIASLSNTASLEEAA